MMPLTMRGKAACTRIFDRLEIGGQINSAEVQVLLMGRVHGKFASLREAAKAWGISPAYLSDVLNGKREPGPKILRVLGLKKMLAVRYLLVKPEATDA